MRIFVTGGTGFIGSHFIDQALRAGHDVTALRRTGSQPRLKLDYEPLWIQGSLDGNFDIFTGYDIFIHFAAHNVIPPDDTIESCFYWNVTASMNMLNQAAKQGIKKFLIAGSCFEYGRSAERYDFIPVDAPLEPITPYAVSKAAASVAFVEWAKKNGLGLSLLRVFHVFGEGESEKRLWPSLRMAALSGNDFPMTKGEQIRDFINVQDVALCFLQEAESMCATNENNVIVRNIGSGNVMSVHAFCRKWWQHWQASGELLVGKISYRAGEVMRYVPRLV
jgi:nucleoside-diphosphate-sugar epimerase